MKTLIKIIAAATIATSMAVPMMASAQIHPNRPLPPRAEARVTMDLNGRIEGLRNDIRDGQRTRQLSAREASRLSTKVNSVASLKRSYERSGRGLSASETATLNGRINVISDQIRTQKHDFNRR